MTQSSGDAQRCIWCRRNRGERVALRVLEPRLWARGTRERSVSVHPEHEMDARRYYARVRSFVHTFLFSLLIGCAAPFVFLAFRWLLGISASLVYIGTIMWLFPFCTPTTVDMLGIRNSVRLARACGLLFFIGGVLLLVWR